MKFSVAKFNRCAHLFRGKSREFFRKNGSTIRTTGICIGVVWTAVEAAKATPKACMAYEDAKMWCEQNNVPFTIIRKLEACGKYYIKPVVIGGLTIGLAIYNEKTNLKTVAGLSAALLREEQNRKELSEAIKEQLGPKKRDELNDSIARQEFERYPIPDEAFICHTGNGNDLFLFEGIWFRSCLKAIENAKLLLEREIEHNSYASENDLLDFLGIDSRLWPSKSAYIGWQRSEDFKLYNKYVGDRDQNMVYTILTYDYDSCPYKDYQYFAEGDIGRY